MSFLLALLLTFSPMASTHMQKDVFEEGGGWMPTEKYMIMSYRSEHLFRIEYKKIISRDKKGSPITKVLDSINLTNNPKKGLGYYILGYHYCISPYKDPNLVIALSGETVVKAWTVVNDKFKSVSAKGIKCDVAGLRE